MSEFSEPKKETVRITLPPPPRPRPVTGNGGNDTVRISSPEVPAAAESMSPSSARPPLPPPLRPPALPLRPPAASNAVSPPAQASSDKEPTSNSSASAAMPPRPRVLPPPPRVQPIGPPAILENHGASDSVSGPKKETARISLRPESVPPARPVKMTKTQPLQMAPPEQAPAARVQVAHVPPPSPSASPDTIPMPLVWAAFVISAITLLIQIWNYFGS